MDSPLSHLASNKTVDLEAQFIWSDMYRQATKNILPLGYR